ncbi:DUF6783 domain-containing protein [Blautia sp.]|uniref:DUF6783 domain-containing protein n=1 Tax=Blautia sp. TaxID=1955243 RepID=UPI003AB5FC1D
MCLKIAFDKLSTMVCRRFLSDKICGVGCIKQIGGRYAAKWIMQIVIIKLKYLLYALIITMFIICCNTCTICEYKIYLYVV